MGRRPFVISTATLDTSGRRKAVRPLRSFRLRVSLLCFLIASLPSTNMWAQNDKPSGRDTKPSAQDTKSSGQDTKVSGENNKSSQEDTREWESRAIVGYHQAGASSANFTQNFFFDFFIMRSLSSQSLWEGRWNLWGDVRIASSPQQITTGVGEFVSGFSTQVSKLPVNQLAQSADFDSGIEYRLHTWTPQGAYRMAGLIGYFGAMGAFDAPQSQMEIFDVPPKNSLQYPSFVAQFPTAANATYVGFVPPNRQRFYRNYGVGVRLTTFDKDNNLAPPATYAFSIGQDESITAGTFQSVVGKFDVFYPLPVSFGDGGAYKFLYLFGTANLRLSKATTVPTFALQNPNANGVTVQPYDPNLAIVTQGNTRDTYRIGAGADLVNLLRSIKPKSKAR